MRIRSIFGRTGRGAGLAVVLFASAVLLSTQAPAQLTSGDPVRGQSLFASKECLRCHAVRGEGGRTGPDLGRKAVRGSFFEIAAELWNHSPSMGAKLREFRMNRPAFEDDELADLVAFLYFLNYFDEPGDPRVGKILFTEKHCIQCHRVGREGGESGPRLDAYPRGVSPLRIAEDLWNHGPAMAEALRADGLEMPQFPGDQIIDLFAFLRSQGRREASREFQSVGDPESGKRLFEAKGCAACHALFGEKPGIGSDLGSAELRGSVTQLAGRMWNHWPTMGGAMESVGVAYPEFEGDELADLFAYIFVVRYDGLPGDARAGQAVYTVIGCAACHGARGEGGDSAPPLEAATVGETKEKIVQAMWNHAPRMLESIEEQGLFWPRLGSKDLADLLALLTRGWPEESTAAQ